MMGSLDRVQPRCDQWIIPGSYGRLTNAQINQRARRQKRPELDKITTQYHTIHRFVDRVRFTRSGLSPIQ